MNGIKPSKTALSKFMIKGSALLQPLVDKMKEKLLGKKALHADETTLGVLCEPDRLAQSNSYMWVYKTSAYDAPIVLDDFQEGRSRKYAKAYLMGFKGYFAICQTELKALYLSTVSLKLQLQAQKIKS